MYFLKPGENFPKTFGNPDLSIAKSVDCKYYSFLNLKHQVKIKKYMFEKKKDLIELNLHSKKDLGENKRTFKMHMHTLLLKLDCFLLMMYAVLTHFLFSITLNILLSLI